MKLRLREEGAIPPPPPPPSGLHVAEAELQPGQIQDLAEKLPDLLHAAAGLELRLRLRVELGGDTPPSDDKLDEIRRLLEEISRDLKLPTMPRSRVVRLGAAACRGSDGPTQ